MTHPDLVLAKAQDKKSEGSQDDLGSLIFLDIECTARTGSMVDIASKNAPSAAIKMGWNVGDSLKVETQSTPNGSHSGSLCNFRFCGRTISLGFSNTTLLAAQQHHT